MRSGQWIISALCVLSCAQHSRGNIVAPWALWSLDRLDCLDGAFTNHASLQLFGSLLLNTSRTSCLHGRGVELTPTSSQVDEKYRVLVQSSETMASLSSLSPSGLSVELWGAFGENSYNNTDDDDDDYLMPLFTIGQGFSGTADFCKQPDVPSESINMQISLRKNGLLSVDLSNLFNAPQGYETFEGLPLSYTCDTQEVGYLAKDTKRT